MSAPEVGYYEFCPRLDGAFGPWLHRGRGRIMTLDRAMKLYERWVRRFGPGALFFTPVCQTSHIVSSVRATPVRKDP